MKVLLKSSSGYGAWFGLRLETEGHSVAYCLDDKRFSPILEGLLAKSEDEPSDPDLVIFDLTGNGAKAEKYDCPVLGDSLLADKLEDDRLFGLDSMRNNKIKVAPYEEFDSIAKARSFIGKTNKRYVFKPCGDDQDTAATYVSSGPADLVEYLDKLEAMSHGSNFILQEFISGIEVSTEGWFLNGKWYFVNHTLEEKKFMSGSIGPNTGCSGNIVWLGSSDSALFKATLDNMTSFLAEHNYYGMVDINTIVTQHGVYGLEWTPRFGYDATATQIQFMKNGFGSFLESFFSEELGDPKEIQKSGFASSIRVSIPPYPLETNKNVYQEGVPVKGITDLASCYLYDVNAEEGTENLVSAGLSGFICSPTAYAFTFGEAFQKIEAYVKKIKIPNMQYRNDIAQSTFKRYKELRGSGWIAS